MTGLKGVLLDVDGTLVDSNDAHAFAWAESIADHGRIIPLEKIRERIGMGGDKLLPLVAGIEVDSPLGKRIGARREEVFRHRYLPRLRAFPGAKALLTRMKARGLKMIAASSAKATELHALLKLCGADELLDGEVSADDVARSKPDPDIVEAAIARAGFSAGELLMLGDTPYDVLAATRAGVPIIALRCGGWDDADLAGAVAIYDNPADLLRQFDDSPLASTWTGIERDISTADDLSAR